MESNGQEEEQLKSNASEGEPLQLIEFVPTKNDESKVTIHLKPTTLDFVFKQIGVLPISVICLCGPSRQGKSFLLGYMIRCLEGLEKEDDDDWMNWSDKKKPLKGFSFRTGIDPETKGIWIWSKPFVIKNDDGNDVAVLLLDTQGTYDEFTSTKEMSAIIGLGLLTSSVMIFNFFSNLQEDVLDALKMYIEYGSMALDQTQNIPFQKLIFLIRDWNIPSQFPYGAKGGKSFLETKLQIKDGQSAEAKHVRGTIKKCFRELDCFLMPGIGENALVADFQGSIGELSPKFSKELENFINGVFLSGTMPVKEILGSPVSASCLRSCLEGYVSIFNSDDIPSVETMWHATTQISNNSVVEKASQKYRDSMKRKLRGNNNFFQLEDLKLAHSNAMKLAMDVFNQAKKLGNSDVILDFQRKLEKQVDADFSEFEILNEEKRRRFVTDATTEASNTFRSELEGEFTFQADDDRAFYDDTKIQKRFVQIKSTLLEEFNEKLLNASEPVDKLSALSKSLEEIMQSILNSLLNKNNANRANAEREMIKIVDELSSNHFSQLEDYLKANNLEEDEFTIKNAHNHLKSAAVGLYQERKKQGNGEFQNNYKDNLESRMENNYIILTNQHNLSIQNVLSHLEASTSGILNQLESDMKKAEDDDVEDDRLKEMFAEKAKFIQEQFKQEINPFPKGSQRSNQFVIKLQEQLQELSRKIFSGVAERKKRSVESWYRALQHALDYYKAEMQQISDSSDFLPEEDLEIEHQRVRKAAIEMYEKIEKIDIPSNAPEINFELREKMDDEWKRIRAQNQTSLDLAVSNTKILVDQCLNEYNQTIRREKHLLPTVEKLQECHEIAKTIALEQLNKNSAVRDPTFLQDYEAELRRKIKASFTEQKRKTLEDVTAATREVSVDARRQYHDEMKKHCDNKQFMKPTHLEDIHGLVKDTVIKRCMQINNRFSRLDLEKDLDGLLGIYLVQNDMSLNSGDAPAIGIDLGTTHCCVAVYYKGQVHIIPNQQQGGIETTPSYVAFNLDGTESYGAPAKRNAYKNAERTIYDAKRIIGRKITDPELQNDQKFWPFTVKEDDGVPKIMCNYKALYPEQISGKLLTHCKEMAESFLKMKPGTIKKAVITVPAYFNDGQRQATVDAGKLAKLEVLTILNEPTAAAIAYSLKRLDIEPRKILIYDLGGGTFDVAVLEMKPKKIEVLGVKGDTHLGGEDFDKKMMEYCASRFLEMHRIDLFDGKDSSVKQIRDDARRRLRRLQTECEWAKKTLATTETAEVTVEAIIEGKDLSVSVTRKKFEELNMAYFEKSIRLVEEALQDVKLRKEDIDDVVLVGGSSRILKVQQMLETLFEGKALNKSIHPDLAVAYGAAVQAAQMNGEQAKGKIDFSQIQDVTPMSIGIEVYSKKLSVILPKNTKIPTKRKEVYSTVDDNQTRIAVNVYQGEDLKLAKNNKLLGKFNLNGIPSKPAGAEPVDIWMEINEMGILQVEAICRSTQGKNSITVTENKQRMSKEAISKILEQETVSVPRRPVVPTPEPRPRKSDEVFQQNDILSMITEHNLSELDMLSKKVDEFQGPHLSQHYDTLIKKCSELKSEMKNQHDAGRMDIRQKNVEALQQIAALELKLSKKVHAYGKKCGKC